MDSFGREGSFRRHKVLLERTEENSEYKVTTTPRNWLNATMIGKAEAYKGMPTKYSKAIKQTKCNSSVPIPI